MKKISKKVSLLLFIALTTGGSILAKEQTSTTNATEIKQPLENQNSIEMPMITDEEPTSDEFLVPNTPMLKPTNIITIRAIGLGVAPANTVSKAQEIALAKRSAIIDAYRQLGEKLHGIQISAKDTVRDAILQSSVVRTKLRSIIKGAEIQETQFSDGLCQVEMTVKLDGRRWYKVLTQQ